MQIKIGRSEKKRFIEPPFLTTRIILWERDSYVFPVGAPSGSHGFYFADLKGRRSKHNTPNRPNKKIMQIKIGRSKKALHEPPFLTTRIILRERDSYVFPVGAPSGSHGFYFADLKGRRSKHNTPKQSNKKIMQI